MKRILTIAAASLAAFCVVAVAADPAAAMALIHVDPTLGLALVGLGSLTETGHAGGFIMSEANGHRSRENVTLVSGQVVKAGEVLGIITSGGKYATYDNQASDGTQAAKAVSINDADASDGDIEIAVIARDAEVNGNELVFSGNSSPTDNTAGEADLLAVGIIVR